MAWSVVEADEGRFGRQPGPTPLTALPPLGLHRYGFIPWDVRKRPRNADHLGSTSAGSRTRSLLCATCAL